MVTLVFIAFFETMYFRDKLGKVKQNVSQRLFLRNLSLTFIFVMSMLNQSGLMRIKIMITQDEFL